jgi:hypothetical protein
LLADLAPGADFATELITDRREEAEREKTREALTEY